MMFSESAKNILTKLLGWTIAVMIFIAFSAQSICDGVGWPVCGGIKYDPRVIIGWPAVVFNVVLIIFNSWLWKSKIGRLLGWRIPDIGGTWRGELEILEHLPGIRTPGHPIPVILVIRQQAFRIQLTLYTNESYSLSVAGEFIKIDEESELVYSYYNEPDPRFRQRSRTHFGTVVCKMVSIKPSIIRGEYYTDRLTAGRMELTEYTDKLATSFQDASRLQFVSRPTIK